MTIMLAPCQELRRIRSGDWINNYRANLLFSDYMLATFLFLAAPAGIGREPQGNRLVQKGLTSSDSFGYTNSSRCGYVEG